MAAAPVARPHRPFVSWAPRRWWVQPTMTVQRGGRKSGQRRARPEGAVWHPRCPRARRLRPQCDRPLAMCRRESLYAAQSCQCHGPRAGWCHCRWRHRRLLVVATTWPRRWRPLASGPDLDWPCAASLAKHGEIRATSSVPVSEKDTLALRLLEGRRGEGGAPTKDSGKHVAVHGVPVLRHKRASLRTRAAHDARCGRVVPSPTWRGPLQQRASERCVCVCVSHAFHTAVHPIQDAPPAPDFIVPDSKTLAHVCA